MDGELQDALAEARKATTMRPASADGVGLVHTLYGWYLMNAFDSAGAVRELRLAEQACRRTDPLVEMQLGHAFALKHDFQSALAHFKESIVLQDEQVWAYRLKGMVYQEQGNVLEAIKCFEQGRRT